MNKIINKESFSILSDNIDVKEINHKIDIF